MTSFVRKIFALLIILGTLNHFGDGYTLVPGIAVPVGSPIPQRLEIRTFAQNTTMRNIYLIALERMQQMNTEDLLSYYRISGIHGTNLAWDNDTGGNFINGNGYCYHGDRLFPPWHRPYLSLYEKTLLDLATELVDQFPPGTHKTNHIAALCTWRMPYWDWAMNASIPSIMSSKTVSVRRMDNGTFKVLNIPNPLSSYRFQIPNDPYTIIFPPDPQTIQTVRNPTVQNNTYVTRTTFTNNQMIGLGSFLTTSVFDALTRSTDYNSFSNMLDGPFSIEGVHGTVHVVVGGGEGHMSFVNFAAFDPIFYLHHTNVDRLFAMWQALFPDSYLTDNSTEFPNASTPLIPFRGADGEYWTSNLARNISAFGYTYPELANFDQQTVLDAVYTLYASPDPEGRRKRALSLDASPTLSSILARTTARVLNTTSGKPLTTSTTSTLVTKSTTSSVATKYNDYQALIQIPNTAGNGPYLLCLFLGEPSSDDSNFYLDPNFVGAVGVFAPKGVSKSSKTLMKRAISLTDAFHKRTATKQLQDLTSRTISTYLNENLRLRILGDKSRQFDLTGFQIDVATAELTISAERNVLPTSGDFESLYKATEVNLASKTEFLAASRDAFLVDEAETIDSTLWVDYQEDLAISSFI